MEQKQIKVKNQKVTYKETGQGEPVLILHGWGADSSSWVPTARLIKEEGYKVIIPDLPGFGKSQEPKEGWKVMDYLNFIGAFKKELDLKEINLIGHSFGGRIAIKAGALNKLNIKRIILVAAAGIKHKKNWRQKIGAKIRPIVKKVPKIKESKIVRKIFAKLIGSEDYFQASPAMKKTLSLVVEENLTEQLKKINIPTLIVWGERDQITPLEDSKKMATKIESSKLEVFPKGSHALYRKKSEKFVKTIIPFLKAPNND